MSKIFGKMVKNERYFLDYFLFLICFNSYFNSCIPYGMQPISFSININFNSCIQGGMQRFCLIIVQALSIAISIHAPAMGATCSAYRLCIISLFQFMRPRWAQLQDLDIILPSILYFVFIYYFLYNHT